MVAPANRCRHPVSETELLQSLGWDEFHHLASRYTADVARLSTSTHGGQPYHKIRHGIGSRIFRVLWMGG